MTPKLEGGLVVGPLNFLFRLPYVMKYRQIAFRRKLARKPQEHQNVRQHNYSRDCLPILHRGGIRIRIRCQCYWFGLIRDTINLTVANARIEQTKTLKVNRFRSRKKVFFFGTLRVGGGCC